ncbi:trafficking kinesin-binding protein 2 isoform X2 [Clupea harengus]|uniref:Trafficking kinesin-binding protein 2 isoform X2 n=1 Tax=Clupea harengus TaxID=7950 RepID=A0A8M1K9X5_CLUHA|nr:trafficking kinesin-binding protein 2 isoform X2 [Clupea harengus]
MYEVKPMSVEKKEAASGTDEAGGRGSSGSGGSGGSLYLYEGQDWVISPACSPDEPSAISPILAEETLRYMILSAERVEQMTKTYNDIEMVTQLLAERDRDLELAARIGQSLLQRNHVLQEHKESLEEQLAQALDRVHQLQHELGKKDELLRMVASASEESETDSSSSATPLKHSHPPGGGSVSLSQLELLQGKLQDLEEENLALRSEACHLTKETITYEEKEQQLVSDCVKELRESNSQMVTLTDELSRKNEELMRHQEEIAQLLSQIVELQHRVKELALEKEELRIHLHASKEAQRQLTEELKEMAERNMECVGMLQESQEENKELRSKQMPSAGLRRHTPYGLYPMDSLAAEIEGSMRKELSVEEEVAFEDQKVSQKRVFQTVRAVNETVVRAASMTPPPPIPGSGSVVMTARPFQSGLASEEEEPADPAKAAARLGQPGSPGGSDLVSALHRLSLRRQNFLCERQFFQMERDRKLQELAQEEGGASGFSSPMGSVVSSFSNLSELSFSSSTFKTFLPEKLQIVKPMEGSLTLHHWQQLAQPHLGSILDPHPGVVTKGFRPLAQDAVYRLNDLEEDEEDEEEGEEDLRREGGRERERERVERRRGGRDGGREKTDEKRGGGGGGDGEKEEEEEDEGGITFLVQCSSTPDERERKQVAMETTRAVPPLSLSPRRSSVVMATTVASSSCSVTPTTCDLPVSLEQDKSGGVCAGVPQASQTLSSTAPPSALNPGKCQSSTFSTYTYTTCRIMHPCDVTQVTSSAVCSPCVSEHTHTPSSMRTGPSTPVTPCLLSLGGNAFPPRHLSTAPPRGLAKLLLERGISAQVSTETAAAPAPAPVPGKPASVPFRLLPSTPPNSPSHSPCPSPVPLDPRPAGAHSSSSSSSSSAAAASDNFLASRPAELFLQDVYGVRLGRSPRPDLPSPEPPPSSSSSSSTDPASSLVERLRRLGLAGVLPGAMEAESSKHRRQDSTFLATGGGSLLDGLRRNQSLPAMIGRGPPRGGAVSSSSHPAQPHPTSLALPTPPWGSLKPHPSSRRHASLSQAPPFQSNH